MFLLTYSVGLMPSGSFRTKMQSSVDSDMGRYAARLEVFTKTQDSRSLQISGFEMFDNHPLLAHDLRSLLCSLDLQSLLCSLTFGMFIELENDRNVYS